ncbi:cytochrome protein [Talaromyces proteolyticus]|uniref:Cytochrome protein n=1 Tax=Talaromyces proteolyticus TaxID=1131652 RepID=A0AAD4KK64_9EURO|nr:cytochrome protein [Talaromyces proteolyticus]KAH8691171.1 cytochrome protein [Talaromyces proteolyticus]
MPAVSVVALLILGMVMVTLWAPQWPRRKLPLINDKNWFELGYTEAKKRFHANGRHLIQLGFTKANDAFWIITDSHPRMVLASKYANVIRNDDRLSLGKFIAQEFHANIRGFEPFGQISSESGIVRDTVRMKLTHALNRIIEPLSHEVTVALQTHWGDSLTWHSFPMSSIMMRIIAQVSSRAFVGEELCRNSAWLDMIANYTEQVFLVARALRLWPKILRPIVAELLPRTWKLRRQIQRARMMIQPVFDQRLAANLEAIKQGKTPNQSTNAMDWLQECAKGRAFDPAILQLTLSFVAIETTSQMLCNVIYDIAERPDLIQVLQEEIITVIKENGWQKSSLQKLKIMDSVLKESQRWKPTSVVSMNRVAEARVQLPDGVEIPKGTSIMVSALQMWDSSVYPDGDQFDPYRFFKLRQIPGQERSSQFVSTSTNHLGFGHGQHSCPGRFFAATELKILLCHLLLKYDFKIIEGRNPQYIMRGHNIMPNPKAKISVRRRQEEIEFL